jgi:hypothetical protein
MFSKLKKPLLITIISFVVFVILVVVLVDRDEDTGKISISFSGKEAKIPSVGFTDLIDDEMELAKLAEINWSEAYNKALEEKYSDQNSSIDFQYGSLRASGREEKKTNKDDEIFRSFIQYLAASETKLDEAKNPLELAIQYRDKNQEDKINELVSDFDKRIANVEKITPPEEVVGYHLAKLRLLREMKGILRMIKESEKGESLEEIITEEEFEHLARLNLILKKYLTYFFYPKIHG